MMLLRFLDAKILLAIVLVAWAIHSGIVQINLSLLKRAAVSVKSFAASVVEEGVNVIKDAD